MRRYHALIAATIAMPGSVLAQSNVSASNRFAWSENAGWFNWRGDGLNGARLHPGFLSGYVWSENLGWINLGNGAVGTCGQYPPPALQTGSAFGVNLNRDPVNPSRLLLSGFAWGENCGWINFSGGAAATPPQPAFVQTVNATAPNGRLRGYAWSESAGWINLDVAVEGQFVWFCYSNCDGSTGAPALTANDFLCFLNTYASGDPTANCDGSTGTPCLTANDFQCFLNAYAVGCS